jgi:hypothetical protein
MTSSEKGTSWRRLSQYQIRAANNAGSQWPRRKLLGPMHIARGLRRCGHGRDHLCFVMLPAKWEQLRTGHWAPEHFLAYFRSHIDCLLRLASSAGDGRRPWSDRGAV